MTRTGLKPNKLTNILRDTEIDKHSGRKHITRRNIHTYKLTNKQTYYGHTQTESLTKN